MKLQHHSFLFPNGIVERTNAAKGCQQIGKTHNHVLMQDGEENIFSHGGTIFAKEAHVGWL
jgi:hypothetical protein